jgi:uncharacterized protein (TIGR03382 family)
MGIGHNGFKIWLTTTIVWLTFIGTMIYAGGLFPAGYQTNFQLRTDLEPWNKEWPVSAPLRRPLYEIIRPPAAEKSPLTFSWRGYSRELWNQHIHAFELPRFIFLSGETLDIPAELTEADRDYVRREFWDQRWKRWGDILSDFAPGAILVPLALFAVLWLVRRRKIRSAGYVPELEPPRLPYSPAMERLRNITLAVSGAEILLWLFIAVLNNRDEPQTLADIVSVMFIAMLPTNAAFAMSLLRRGPLTATALAGLALLMLLPQVVGRLLPAS